MDSDPKLPQQSTAEPPRHDSMSPGKAADGNGHAAPTNHDAYNRDLSARGKKDAGESVSEKSGQPEHVDEIGAPPPTPHPKRLGLLVLAMAAAAVLAGLFFLGWLPRHYQREGLAADAERIKNAIPRVHVARPRQSPAVTVALLPGDVQALEETTVYPRTSGYLKRWLVDIGDQVKEGQLLAEIDTPDVDQQLLQAKASLGQLKAKQLTAEATFRLADTTRRRYDELDKQNAASKLEVDQHRADAETAQAALEAAKADVKGGEADVMRLTTLQEFSKVYAPFDGTITARNVEIGQLLTNGNSSGQTLFHIAKTNPVRVFVNVPQMYSPGVKAGLKAELVVREMPGRRFVGQVARTAGAIDPTTRTLLTEVDVPNDKHLLLTGSYVQVKMDVERDNPPLLIPAAALIFNAQGTHVAVVDEQNHVHFKPVEVDADFGSDVGISSGLSVVDLVVANPGERLVEGGEVQVDSTQSTPPATTPG
jgi:RND family efflux transporter MFP subunit